MTQHIAAATVPVLPSRNVVRGVADGGVLLDTKSGQIYSCNDTASVFLGRVDGVSSIAAICTTMVEDFDVTEADLCSDMVELAHDLVEQGLLELK